jgi:homoserine O-acetyltransferase
LLVGTFIEAIISDPAFDGGWYTDARLVHRGLRRVARLFAVSGFFEAFFNQRNWKTLGFTNVDDFVTGFVENHFVPQDPNNLILLAQKWRANDASRITGGDLESALARIKAKTFVIAIEEDGFFQLADIAADQALIPGSELKRISSAWGHRALFGIDTDYCRIIDGYLNELLQAA